MADEKKSIPLKTGLSWDYIQNVLVRDIDCKECLLDLIDNSIDAAREEILSIETDLDPYGVPKSYAGYEIEIGCDASSGELSVHDTCSGIDQETIRDRLLLIGQQSNSKHAIGHFGVGLKRALLKLGQNYEIETSNGSEIFIIEFSASDLTQGSSSITAIGETGGEYHKGTKIWIRIATEEARREVYQNPEWETRIRREIGIRYSVFINKGLTIRYEGVVVDSLCPELKTFEDIEIQQGHISGLPHNIQVSIEAGLHSSYSLDSNNQTKLNEPLSDEYGWYFVCNDRVIKIACRDSEYGWVTRWHNEYNGFVGWVYIVGDVAHLPWNTKKTDIDSSSEVFGEIKDHLNSYASNFRSQNRKVKKKEADRKKNAEKGGSPHGSEKDSQEPGNQGGAEEPSNDPQSADNSGPDSASESKGEGTNTQEQPAGGQHEGDGADSADDANQQSGVGTKIPESLALAEELRKLKSKKLGSFYNSICKLSLIGHPLIAYVGVWSFLETLAKLSGANANTSFDAYFPTKIHAWYPSDKDYRKKLISIVKDIADKGNLVKHDGQYYLVDARQLIVDMQELEQFLLDLVKDLPAEHRI